MDVRLKVFAIYDVKADAYHPPIVFKAVGQAVRWFADLMKDENQPYCRHVADYSFCQIGFYDEVTGRLEACPVATVSHGLAHTPQDESVVSIKKEALS